MGSMPCFSSQAGRSRLLKRATPMTRRLLPACLQRAGGHAGEGRAHFAADAEDQDVAIEAASVSMTPGVGVLRRSSS